MLSSRKVLILRTVKFTVYRPPSTALLWPERVHLLPHHVCHCREKVSIVLHGLGKAPREVGKHGGVELVLLPLRRACQRRKKHVVRQFCRRDRPRQVDERQRIELVQPQLCGPCYRRVKGGELLEFLDNSMKNIKNKKLNSLTFILIKSWLS